MGISPFSTSFNISEKPNAPLPLPPNPNPYKFDIELSRRVGSYLCLVVHYPGVTSFEGRKVMVLDTTQSVSDIKVLDPHFSLLGEVVARFLPTTNGWNDAIQYAENKQ